MNRILLSLMLTATPLMAQDWNTRATDQLLSESELADRIVGQTITFYDNGKSQFYDDGRYTYTYDGGGTAYGYFELQPNGVVCIDYVNGFKRCDRFVLSGAGLVLLTEAGDRFPLRP